MIMAKEKKNGRGKKALKIIGIILAVIVAIVAILAVVNVIGDKANLNKALSFSAVEYENQLVPQVDEDGNYYFTTDEDLKILQLTDVHIGGGFLSFKKDSMALNAVAAMVTAEKPDLVIITGDVAYPVPFQAGTFNNKVSANIFANLMESLGVYWTLAFGNHDTEAYSFYNREQISEFYESEEFKYCIFVAGPEDIDGYGNQIINVKKTNGMISQTLYVFDTGSYVDNDYFGALWKYDNLHQNQIDWYAENVEKYNQQNAELAKTLKVKGDTDVKSMAFFHIPLTEYKTAWYEYVENGFEDTDDTKLVYGTAGEGKKVVYCGLYDNEFFETAKELGSLQAVFCGHDHKNNFSLDYQGIRLTYGLSVDYLAYIGIYKLGSQRGCTVITVSPDGSFDCTAENYYQDKYTSTYAKEEVTMQEVEVVTAFTEE